ncbi:unnamed protein product [Gordionus sp. m RMFG-2023]|uniref:26S proteasome non-ATPase regulatory subunit 13-like n=1 Tax=Gordionus sp. m RMFG-2023 TaxID=3053472 RepID=UPI0030DE4891
MIDPRAYVNEQKKKYPSLHKEWEILEEFYEKKLWHQLTLKLEDFIRNEHFVSNGGLVDLYEKFIFEFENRISSLVLIKLAIEISVEIKDTEERIKFLQKIKDKVSLNKEADALAYTALGHIYLTRKDYSKTKELLDKAEEMLDKLNGISPVHCELYRLSSEYYYEIKDYVLYYKETLKFLGVMDIDKLSKEEMERYAYNLSIASLLGEDIYNFNELLSHPVFDSMRNSSDQAKDYGWLVELLYAFNGGDLKKMEKLKPRWSKMSLLKEKSTLLEKKIKLLCLMEMTYKKPANNRQLTFEEISKGAEVPIKDVENLVMKALSLNLVKGYIDEIDKKVYMKWVQPRVLDLKQIATMNQILGKWSDDIKSVEDTFHENAKELIHF